MTIDYERAMATRAVGVPVTYNFKDAMLYALGLGFGRNALSLDELAFVFEKAPTTVPTFATTLAFAGDITARLGINLRFLVHGEQGIVFHRPMPPTASAIVDTRVADMIDKGEDKGAIIIIESAARLADTGEPLVTLTSALFARADGGFLKQGQVNGQQARAHPIPDRPADYIDVFETRADQALLYRLSGDFNPLHADPAVAVAAGFERPILQGLCTYGICCRAILKQVLRYDAGLIAAFHARFSSPVVPGETISTEMWLDEDVVSFRARVMERDTVVVNNGKCQLVGSRSSMEPRQTPGEMDVQALGC
jgi:acyl dehydratase